MGFFRKKGQIDRWYPYPSAFDMAAVILVLACAHLAYSVPWSPGHLKVYLLTLLLVLTRTVWRYHDSPRP